MSKRHTIWPRGVLFGPIHFTCAHPNPVCLIGGDLWWETCWRLGQLALEGDNVIIKDDSPYAFHFCRLCFFDSQYWVLIMQEDMQN